MKTINKTDLTNKFEIEGIGLLHVTFDCVIKVHPVRIEETHGRHRFSEDEIDYSIKSIRLKLFKDDIEMIPALSKETLNFIEANLNIE